MPASGPFPGSYLISVSQLDLQHNPDSFSDQGKAARKGATTLERRRVIMRKTGIVLAMLVFAASGCAPQADVETDKAAIRNLHDQTAAASNAGDLAALYTEDAIVMPPNEPAVVGKEAIGTWVQGLFEQFTVKETATTEEIQVAGDWAFLRGTYTATMTPKEGGESQEETGKCIHIVQRQPDGSWKNTRIMWNSDEPAPVAPTP